MDLIFINVVHQSEVFASFAIRKDSIIQYKQFDFFRCGDAAERPSKQQVKLVLDQIFLHYFLRELDLSSVYRISFIKNFYSHVHSDVNAVKLILAPAAKEIIDYRWNERTTYLVRERCELEHTLSWLSTLGGAFSALGDYFENCAETAGKISLNQMKLAFRLDDPNVVSRCRLYLSLSLIQRNRFRLARQIVYREFVNAKNGAVVDTKLVNMCKGIWCKLKYEYCVYKKSKALLK